MATTRLPEFEHDITRARDLVGLGQAIGTITNGLVNASDLYRAALVQAVAAWDRYVHGVILDRGVQIVLGSLAAPTKPRDVGLPMYAIAALMAAPDAATRELTARIFVAERLAKETYQRPDDVAAGLAMVGVPKIWSTAFPNAETAKLALGLIVGRRNNIVHACDYDPVSATSPTGLPAADALDAVHTIRDTVRAIDPFC